MKVIFSHGKESGPNGQKIVQLSQIALDKELHVQSVDYRGIADPEARADKLVEVLSASSGPYLLVGSSMGAYVSLVASQNTHVAGLFLLAPAIGLPGYARHHFDLTGFNVEIIQGWQDTVVPVESVIDFARTHRATLHLVNSDHRLTTVLPNACALFGQWLQTQIVTE